MKYLQKIRYWLLLSLVVLFLASIFFIPAQAQDQLLVSRTYEIDSDVFGIRPMAGTSEVYEFFLNNQVVLRYRSMYQGLSAQERAGIILERVQNMGQAMRDGKAETGKIGESYVVTINGQLFVTVTEADFRANNSTGEGLANVWLRNLQAARTKQSEPIDPQTQGDDEQSKPINSQKSRVERSKRSGKTEKNNPPVDNPPVDNPPAGNPSLNEPPVNGPIIAEPENRPEDIVVDADCSTEEAEMLKLINQERAKAGAAPLTMDPELVKVARMKSRDMIANNYFDHNSPTYGDPFTMMTNMGIKYGYAGENLAGNPSLANAHETLMNSPGHRKNILNPNYTHAGIGIVEGGPYGKMFTQLFISKL